MKLFIISPHPPFGKALEILFAFYLLQTYKYIRHFFSKDLKMAPFDSTSVLGRGMQSRTKKGARGLIWDH